MVEKCFMYRVVHKFATPWRFFLRYLNILAPVNSYFGSAMIVSCVIQASTLAFRASPFYMFGRSLKPSCFSQQLVKSSPTKNINEKIVFELVSKYYLPSMDSVSVWLCGVVFYHSLCTVRGCKLSYKITAEKFVGVANLWTTQIKIISLYDRSKLFLCTLDRKVSLNWISCESPSALSFRHRFVFAVWLTFIAFGENENCFHVLYIFRCRTMRSSDC